jgi:hypothetical protein
MPTITNQLLTVEPVDGHPGLRTVRVSFDVTCDEAEAASGRALVALIVVHAVDEHDAPVGPARDPVVEAHQMLPAQAGTTHQNLEVLVPRPALDVEQDWWSTDLGGGPEPIAEWVDHIGARIELHELGDAVAQAQTPTVTGSWGALGND